MDQNILLQATEKLETIADMLYKGNTQTGIANMAAVIPDIAVISTWINDEATKTRLVSDALTPAMEAMENADGIMLADIITYELLDIFKGL